MAKDKQVELEVLSVGISNLKLCRLCDICTDASSAS
jgi:hypothetical protein